MEKNRIEKQLLSFAALRFTEDVRLSDRVYWYLTDLDVKEGEAVLAPVGAHDRLQKARVEKTLKADDAHAPYPVALIKRVAARAGEREKEIRGVPCLDFGGVLYDDRHYTRFGRLYRAETGNFPEPSLKDAAAALSSGRRVFVRGDELFFLLLAFLKGEEDARDTLLSFGLSEEKLAALRAFLG